MTADLVDHRLRPGMHRADVLRLLGTPDQPPSREEAVYYLTRDESPSAPTSFLVLAFEGERLARVRIADD
jgi:P pilus assembly chaperone PapD